VQAVAKTPDITARSKLRRNVLTIILLPNLR
jgi:hypothetical protein